jgi:hypothetical protein
MIDLLETVFNLSFFVGFMLGGTELYILILTSSGGKEE